jgi:hypothetical protein
VHQRLFQRLVGILVLDVLADDRDVDFVLGVVDAVHQLFPLRSGRARELHVQILEHQRVHAFLARTPAALRRWTARLSR